MTPDPAGDAPHDATHNSRRKRSRNPGPSHTVDKDGPQRKKPRRPGKLAKLQELPLEVLLVIFGFLHPYSLLRLSRTTKFLRKLLMTRSSRETWICSLETVPGLPGCPEDMSEPAFAHLAFDKSCHECFKHTTLDAHWPLRLRLCKDCEKSDSLVLFGTHSFWVRYPILARMNELPGILPFSEELEPCAMLPQHCLELESQLSELEKGSDAYEQCLTGRRLSTAPIIEHGQKCIRWEQNSKAQRDQELEEGHQRRRADVEMKLDALGYGQMFRWIHDDDQSGDVARWNACRDFRKLKVIKDPKPLTERIWANAQPSVTSVLEKHREAFERAYAKLIRVYRMDLLNAVAEMAYEQEDVPANLHVPRGVHLLELPDIRNLIEQPVDSKSQEDTLEPETILATIKALNPEHLASQSMHRQSIALQDSIRAYWREQDQDCANPKLATLVFQCTSSYFDCGPPMSYHQALYHRCLRTSMSKECELMSKSTPKWISSAPLARIEETHAFVRKPTRVINDCIGITPCSLQLHMVIASLGFDPQTTTSADMDQTDPWFSCGCGKCTQYTLSGRKRVFDWRHIILHKPLRYLFDAVRLAQEEEREARRMRDTIPVLVPNENENSYRSAMIWQCVHCDKSPITTAEMVDHLSVRHKVGYPKLDQDFRTSPHCLAPFTGPVIISLKG